MTRKILIIFLTITFIFNALILPKKAEGLGDVVWDPGNWIANLGSWIWDKLTKTVLDTNWWEQKLNESLRDVVAKRLIDYVVDETIEWIQGGGKPQFVSNWKEFLRQAGNIAFDQVIKDVGLARLCSPFKLQVQLSLLPVPTFSQRIDCTLDDVVKNIEDFYRDFENGGWIAYNEAWQPQNNYYGQMLMIHDETLRRVAEQTEAAANEALASKGFLSAKRCVVYDDYTGECLKEEIITPGSTVGAAVAKAITSDIDWAAGIESSWTSALVNAVINRLVREGVGLMKDSSESDDSYYPPEYTDLTEEEIQQEKQQQISQVKELVNEWQYLFDAKTKSLSYAKQLKTVLTEIKNRNCEPPVLDSEIQAVQTDIDRLKTETADLKEKIDKGNNLITEITNANTITERTIARQKLLVFTNEYNTPEFQEQILTGSAREAADKELNNKTNDLLMAQTRLNTCIQTTTSTQP